MRRFLLLVLCLLASAPARAAWMEASSPHFVVYADDSERDLRSFADKLERYHAAMALVTGSADQQPPSPSARVTVFVVKTERELRQLYGGKDAKMVSGFYIPRAGGSLAIVPQVSGVGRSEPDFSMVALLHEYAHHFLMTSSNFPAPRWFNEGGAEFFASAKFEANGDVWLGRPAEHRGGELFFGVDVSAEDLLDPESYEKHHRGGYDAFYGKSWLLYHYLAFTPARSGQLRPI